MIYRITLYDKLIGNIVWQIEYLKIAMFCLSNYQLRIIFLKYCQIIFSWYKIMLFFPICVFY